MQESSARIFLAIFVLAFTVRVVVGLTLADLPLSRAPKLDSFQYLSWARQIAAGNHVWPAPSPQGPGYPYFLAASLSLTDSLLVIRVIQAAIGALSCVLTARLGAAWFGRMPGALAGSLQAVYGPLVYVETALLPEGILIFLLLASLAVMSGAGRSIPRIALAGFILGAAAIVRATALAFGIAYLATLMRRAETRAAALRAGVVFFAAMAAPVLPTVLHNVEATGSWQIQGFAGLNFYIGNRSAGDGTAEFRLGNGWEWLEGEALRAGAATPAQQDSYYFRKTFREIAEHRAQWLRLLAIKTGWLIQSEEIRDSHSYYFFRDQSALLASLPGFGVLFALAGAGMLASIMMSRLRLELVSYLVAAAATLVVLVAGTRYRLPMIPALCIAAGAGVSAAVASLREHRWRRLAAITAAAVLSGFASHAWTHPASRQVAEEWAFTASSLNTERRLGDAESAARRAVTLDPRCGYGWDVLGLILSNQGRPADAEAAFRTALQIDPNGARAHVHLARLLAETGRWNDAVPHLRQAVHISPADIAARKALAKSLLMAGDYAGALRELTSLSSQSPHDPEVSEMIREARQRR